MENYIMFKGQKIELTEEQISQMERASRAESCGEKSPWMDAPYMLADIPAGETFKIGNYEFVVLEHCKGGTNVIFKDLLRESEEFGDCNNFKDSNADRICSEFATEIEKIIGPVNLLIHTVDLTSDDGLKCYGSVERRMSLLTTELYRRWVDILDKHKLNKWWWLATPFSTPKHDGDNWVKCVSPSGDISNNYCNDYYGVRPFCILKSEIFVSR